MQWQSTVKHRSGTEKHGRARRRQSKAEKCVATAEKSKGKALISLAMEWRSEEMRRNGREKR